MKQEKHPNKRGRLYNQVKEAEQKFWSKPGRSGILASSAFKKTNNNFFSQTKKEVMSVQDEEDNEQ